MRENRLKWFRMKSRARIRESRRHMQSRFLWSTVPPDGGTKPRTTLLWWYPRRRRKWFLVRCISWNHSHVLLLLLCVVFREIVGIALLPQKKTRLSLIIVEKKWHKWLLHFGKFVMRYGLTIIDQRYFVQNKVIYEIWTVHCLNLKWKFKKLLKEP